MTATIWRSCPSCSSSFEQPGDPGRKRIYCSRPASRLPTAPQPAHQRWPGQRPPGSPPGLALAVTASATNTPAPIGPAPANASTSAKTGRTSSTTSAGRRREALTAAVPAPAAATIWRASDASPPRRYARPPPACRTRRPAARRSRLCVLHGLIDRGLRDQQGTVTAVS